MKVYNSILDCIGNTPIVKLNKITKNIPGHFYVKCEFLNPGGSVKDRIGAYLIEDAERRGKLKAGGTLVEATSGNTGVGLAMAAAVKGYKCIFVLPDKMSQEKVQTLKSLGAQVVITPSRVAPEDPRSHYSVARKIANETPGAYLTEQYDNLANREAHYKNTGPEIWSQLPEIDVLVGGMGTGGTLCGTGKYLKEKKSSCEIVCADPYGSIIFDHFYHGKTVEPHAPYLVEGIGEDFIPKNFDLALLSGVERVKDIDSFILARKLLHEEGLFVGISSGAALAGAIQWAKRDPKKYQDRHILVILPDDGDRYRSKTWNDPWLKAQNVWNEDMPRTPNVKKVSDALGDYELL